MPVGTPASESGLTTDYGFLTLPMPTLPQLLEEDIQGLDSALMDLIAKSEADAALVIDKGGFLLTKSGAVDRFDSTTLGALAAGAFAATQGVANLIGETDFNCVYQQGENFSVLVSNVDEQALLLVVFKASVSAGAVKYYAASAITRIADQLRTARQWAPDQGLDLSALNLPDTSEIFRKRQG